MEPGNPIVAQTVLRTPAIQSPNYVHGVSGWAIFQDGTAEFHDIELPAGVAGATVYFSSTPPGGANVGDLWYNTSADLELAQWTGTFWQTYQFGSDAIAPGGVSLPNLDTSVTSRALGGITTTVSATAPSNPNTGDIWINTSMGNELEQWGGAAWAPITWAATDVLQAGTISAALITAGTITGSLIAAGTITGSNIQAGSINTTQLNANAINGFTITGVTINAGTINASDVNITSGAGNAIFIYA